MEKEILEYNGVFFIVHTEMDGDNVKGSIYFSDEDENYMDINSDETHTELNDNCRVFYSFYATNRGVFDCRFYIPTELNEDEFFFINCIWDDIKHGVKIMLNDKEAIK